MPPSAVLETLDRLWAALEPLGLPMALMGGLALSVWKHVRATQDVDVLLGVDQDAIDLVLETVIVAGFRPKRTPPTVSLGSFDVLQLEFEPEDTFVTVQADLLLVDSDYHRLALQRHVAITLPELGRQIAVLSCEDLLLHKLLAGRLIDLADAAALVRANRVTIDVEYLTRWARQLNLVEDLRRVWAEALPDEESPLEGQS